MPATHSPQVDTYIGKAAGFAQPILRHVRALVHEVGPEIQETLKWGFPHFVREEAIVCSMAAFKAHCVVGFWHQEMEKRIAKERGTTNDAMGLLGRITSLKDLPKDAVLRRYFRTAAELAVSDKPARARRATPRPALPVPPNLAAALGRNAAARKTFENFPPSHRREYIEWITEAKREETRAKRLATTIEWLAAGKQRNWQYEKC